MISFVNQSGRSIDHLVAQSGQTIQEWPEANAVSKEMVYEQIPPDGTILLESADYTDLEGTVIYYLDVTVEGVEQKIGCIIETPAGDTNFPFRRDIQLVS
ncbi:MAG: hypothetical protein PHW04_12950 [Candidatus Wallbacteria bacterium]|nr:hypothetical protein [Candidatus Wallbacteria bacterium]